MKRFILPFIIISAAGVSVAAGSVDGAGETKPAATTASPVLGNCDETLAQGLRDRRVALDDRARKLDEREATLKQLESDITARAQKLEREMAALEDRVGIGEQAGAAQKKRTEELVGALSRLSPRKAAPILERADAELAVQVLSRVAPDNAMALLSQIDPERAAGLLGRLTQLGGRVDPLAKRAKDDK